MCDEFIHPGLVEDTRLSRRTFGLIAAAAAGAAGTACAAAPKTAVDESDVSIKTSDGTAACSQPFFLNCTKWTASDVSITSAV